MAFAFFVSSIVKGGYFVCTYVHQNSLFCDVSRYADSEDGFATGRFFVIVSYVIERWGRGEGSVFLTRKNILSTTVQSQKCPIENTIGVLKPILKLSGR